MESLAYLYSACIFALLVRSIASDDHKAVNVEVYSFDNCPSEEPFTISFENLTMRMDFDTKKLHVSGVLDMQVPWTVDIKTHIKLFKCLSRDDAKSCNKYLETNMNEICAHMDEKDKQWTPFVEAVKKFDPHCPVKAGRYDVVEAPIETDMLEDMQAALGIWHFGFTASIGDKMLMCTDAGIEIKRARRSKKKNAFP